MPASLRDHWKTRLHDASRSRGFLWKFALVSLLIGTLAGWALSMRRPMHSYLFGERVLAFGGLIAPNDDDKFQSPAETAPGLLDTFRRELAVHPPRFIDVLWAMPSLASYVAVADRTSLQAALAAHFTPDEAALAVDYLAATNPDDHAAFGRLSARTTQPAPPRFARYALGELQMKRKNYRAAFAAFREEGKIDDARESRFGAVQALAELRDSAMFAQLSADPRYAAFITPHVRLRVAVGTRRWLDILKIIPAVKLQSYQHDVIVVTLVAGLAWALFLFHLGEVPGVFSRIAALCGAGFLAGIASTTLTVFLVIVQDDILGFSAGEDLAHTFAYYLAGVGAREELSKLLLFVPLLPFLMKRDDEKEALLVATFVGLGFAIEENGNYFLMSSGATAPGRFLTANFFHIALTGLNGLALFRACTRGMSGVNDLMVVLPVTILAHGAYDALLSLPGVDGASFFAVTVYIGFCFYFFSRVHPLRDEVRMTLSLSGAFVIGISLLGAAVIAFQMATLGPAAGASLIFRELTGSAVLLLMFFREFNEPLTP